MRFSVAGVVALVAAATGMPLSHKPHTVDNSNTHSDWVTSYSNKANDHVTVDNSNTRSDWVTSYPKKAGSNFAPSKSGGKLVLGHWIPPGPAYSVGTTFDAQTQMSTAIAI
ncbi:hypothetical protein BGZ61DRAFT_595155 [Ilyonectria robusta]|uniref:uncharacterized protein n=1 Tax=Ilyonectria robusta TaxID=1079257 RepID=UPI001E8EA956|nr:uncharacterized protein BGZ61DRAFT_595155 [Ilyonectria robusta]KAH8650412.1 hypothetical protein BGZ61DRAFT_595155 [Ilyonectria robusta]